MSEFKLFLEQAITFFEKNKSLPAQIYIEALNQLPPENLIAIQELVDQLQQFFRDTISPCHQQLLLEWKANNYASFFKGVPDISTFLWKKQSGHHLSLHELIYQRVCLCAIYRFLVREGFYTGKQWRRDEISKLVDYVRSSIKEAKGISRITIENVIKDHMRYGKDYDEWATELGGDIYLFVTPEQKKRDHIWRRFRDRIPQSQRKKETAKQKRDQHGQHLERSKLRSEATFIVKKLQLEGSLIRAIDTISTEVRLMIPIKPAPRYKRKCKRSSIVAAPNAEHTSTVSQEQNSAPIENEVPDPLTLQTHQYINSYIEIPPYTNPTYMASPYINPPYIDPHYIDPHYIDPPYIDPTQFATDTLFIASMFSPETLQDSSYIQHGLGQ